MLHRSKTAIVAAVLIAAATPLALHAATGNFTTPLTNAFLSADLNGGIVASNIAPTNGYNENTSSGGFSADNFGVLWSGWGGPTFSGGDGTQLPDSQASPAVNGSTITKTFAVGGSAFYGVTNTITPPVSATISINTATNSAAYATTNSLPSLNSRDRGSPTAANGVNDSDMFRDLLFAGGSGSNVQSSNYMQLALSGLTAGVSYTVALYSYDSSGSHTTNWSATAPTLQAGLTGYFAAGTNNFVAPADEQSITWTSGTTPAPALFTLAADNTGTINLYGFGGNGLTGTQASDTSYLNGFQIATAKTPEPASLGLLALGALGLIGRRRKA